MSIEERRSALNGSRRAIPAGHPRLFGGRADLVALAEQRPAAYRRMREFALKPRPDGHDNYYGGQAQIFGLAIMHQVEENKDFGRQAVELVLKRYIDRNIEIGHVPFGTSMARCGIAYDLCRALWSDDECRRLYDYAHRTIYHNLDQEPSPFHNGWFGYKNWGFGIYAYATHGEDPEAQEILHNLEEEYLRRAAPALKMAGAGGVWAEGYYIHYWLHEWLFFCDIARRCDGADYFATVPEFYGRRAIASVMENYPACDRQTFRPVSMGDGGGRGLHNERDKTLGARRILVNNHRDDPAHQAVHTFNEMAHTHFDHNAYMDFFWHDTTVPKGDLTSLPLSLHGTGAGYVLARSSWEEDATHFSFRCGRRFTAHQHLDNGHFTIFKHAELLGDGGHYDTFGGDHDVNYLMRTIAHNGILIHDPDEVFPSKGGKLRKGMRDGAAGTNDGGQAYPWPGTVYHHNGSAWDVNHYYQQPELLDIGKIVAFEDAGAYVYVAGDYTRSYSAHKVERVTRQIVFLRPGTFVVLDRVKSTRAGYRKALVLQAAKPPEERDGRLVITNGNGRLFVQTLLPARPRVTMHQGEGLYTYGGQPHPFQRDTGPAPECRIEISPREPALLDCFLQVLTATDAGTSEVRPAAVRVETAAVVVELPEGSVRFPIDRLGGALTLAGTTRRLGGAAAR